MDSRYGGFVLGDAVGWIERRTVMKDVPYLSVMDHGLAAEYLPGETQDGRLIKSVCSMERNSEERK